MFNKHSILALALIVFFRPAFAFETVAQLKGVAAVVDGDGVLFGQVEVRLQGIAAPELSDPMGTESYENLRRLAEGKEVVCDLDGTVAGRSRRPVGICYVDSMDLGQQQVAMGFALDCPRYSGGRYENAELEAVSGGNRLARVYRLPDYCR